MIVSPSLERAHISVYWMTESICEVRRLLTVDYGECLNQKLGNLLKFVPPLGGGRCGVVAGLWRRGVSPVPAYRPAHHQSGDTRSDLRGTSHGEVCCLVSREEGEERVTISWRQTLFGELNIEDVSPPPAPVISPTCWSFVFWSFSQNWIPSSVRGQREQQHHSPGNVNQSVFSRALTGPVISQRGNRKINSVGRDRI